MSGVYDFLARGNPDAGRYKLGKEQNRIEEEKLRESARMQAERLASEENLQARLEEMRQSGAITLEEERGLQARKTGGYEYGLKEPERKRNMALEAFKALDALKASKEQIGTFSPELADVSPRGVTSTHGQAELMHGRAALNAAENAKLFRETPEDKIRVAVETDRQKKERAQYEAGGYNDLAKTIRSSRAGEMSPVLDDKSMSLAVEPFLSRLESYTPTNMHPGPLPVDRETVADLMTNAQPDPVSSLDKRTGKTITSETDPAIPTKSQVAARLMRAHDQGTIDLGPVRHELNAVGRRARPGGGTGVTMQDINNLLTHIQGQSQPAGQ